MLPPRFDRLPWTVDAGLATRKRAALPTRRSARPPWPGDAGLATRRRAPFPPREGRHDKGGTPPRAARACLAAVDYARLVDYHVHHDRCGHAVDSMEAYVRAALDK